MIVGKLAFALLLSAATAGPAIEQVARHHAALLHRDACVHGIAVREVHVDGDRATADLEIATAVGAQIRVGALRLRLVREREQWRVAGAEWPDAELAEQWTEGDLPRATNGVAHALADRARALLIHADHAKTREAAKLAREVAQYAGDRAAEAHALSVLVTVDAVRERDVIAPLGREAVTLAEDSGDPVALAWAWLAMANTQLAVDQQSAAADESLRRAHSFAIAGGQPAQVTTTMHILAGRAFLRGDHFTARRLLERSVPTMRASGQWSFELWYDVQLAYIYYLQDDFERSLHHLQRGLRVAEERNAWVLPFARLRLAELYIAQERFDEAAEVLRRAAPAIADKRGLHATLLTQRAHIEAVRGDMDEAECLARAAGESWSSAGYHYGPALDVLLPYLQKEQQQRKQLSFALEHAHHVQERQPASAVRALTAAAAAYRALGFPARAQAAIEEAIAIREEMHERIAGGDDQQVRASDWTASCYELAADIALDRGATEEALAHVESSRGRVLFEALQHGRARAAAADRRREEALARINNALVAAEANGDGRAAARLRAELDAARRDYQSYLDGVRAREERRTASSRPVDGASVTELLHKLPRGVVAVEYVLRDDCLHAFVVRGGVVTRRTTRLERARFERQATDLVERIAKRNLRYRTAARELYALLLAPLERELAGAELLVIVPDDVLWRIPFAALLDNDGRFALERWPIVYAPSISIYLAMTGRPRASAGVLALANPAIPHQSSTDLESFYRGLDLGPLPHAEREADALCALYGPRQCTVLRRGEATETRVRAAIGRHSIVHFATHGVLDDRNAMYSRLLLGRGSDAGDDGALEAWEIARLDIDADLVVLSACDTARGAIRNGEGVVGMAWAFFVAGARSTLATQWKVSSEATAELMIDFHRALRTRGTHASALRQAQLRTLRHAETKHPFYWASFVVLGGS